MMLPNQISSQRFSAAGKGGYRASEVDAFIQKVFQNYNKLFNDNNILKERLSSITPLIDEYNENKKAIANALIWAQTTSDKTINDAKNEAKLLLDEAADEGKQLLEVKKAEAEAVYSEKLEEARVNLDKATKEYELIRSESAALSEKYISEVNAKAAEIIEDANAKASKIVADAYNDAKSAREKADAILDSAKSELLAIKKESAKLKKELEDAMRFTSETLASLTVEVEEFQISEDSEEKKIDALKLEKSDIEEFSIDFADMIQDSEDIKAEVEAEQSFGIQVETVIDEEINEENKSDDLISGSSKDEMLDVNAYISKIFESVGNNDSDFSSFTDGLNDILEQSFEGSEISFEELQKSIDKDEEAFEE